MKPVHQTQFVPKPGDPRTTGNCIAHDPHPDGTGLEGEPEDQWILVPLDPGDWVRRIPQSAVSRMERQGDLLLSTLRSYVTAIGGSLRIVVSLNAREAELDLGDPA